MPDRMNADEQTPMRTLANVLHRHMDLNTNIAILSELMERNKRLFAASGRRYTFCDTPEHGYLKVPVADIFALHLTAEISGCSFLSDDSQYVYLEEDRDMPLFLNALKEYGEDSMRWEDENVQYRCVDDADIKCLRRWGS